MPISSSTHRSQARAVQVKFRCSPADHAELRRRAQEEGVTVQTYIERRLLGRPDAQDLTTTPTRYLKPHGQEELPMTG